MFLELLFSKLNIIIKISLVSNDCQSFFSKMLFENLKNAKPLSAYQVSEI